MICVSHAFHLAQPWFVLEVPQLEDRGLYDMCSSNLTGRRRRLQHIPSKIFSTSGRKFATGVTGASKNGRTMQGMIC